VMVSDCGVVKVPEGETESQPDVPLDMDALTEIRLALDAETASDARDREVLPAVEVSEMEEGERVRGLPPSWPSAKGAAIALATKKATAIQARECFIHVLLDSEPRARGAEIAWNCARLDVSRPVEAEGAKPLWTQEGRCPADREAVRRENGRCGKTC